MSIDMPQLRERLTDELAALPETPGRPYSWIGAQVVRRRRRRRRMAGAGVVAVAAVVATVLALSGGTSHRDGVRPIGPAPSATTSAIGNWIWDLDNERRVDLAAPVGSRFAGPAALWSTDRKSLVYNSFEQHGVAGVNDVPAIRVHDIASGDDHVLASSAGSIAWSASGKLAYFQGDSPPPGAVANAWWPNGKVVVRASLDAEPVVWTPASARYSVLGWAGDRLLAYRTPKDQESAGELLVLDGPGRSRVIGPDSTTLLAIDPTGTYALVSHSAFEESADRISIVDVRNGHTIGSVGTEYRGRTLNLGPFGTWEGNQAVVSTGDGFAILEVGPGQSPAISIQRVIPVPPTVAPFVNQAWFSNGRAHVVGLAIDRLPNGVSDQDVHDVLVDCVAATGACAVSPIGATADQHTVVAQRSNPSRPLPSTEQR